jgi:hypothetical protein
MRDPGVPPIGAVAPASVQLVAKTMKMVDVW